MRPYQTALLVIGTSVVAVALSNDDKWITGLFVLVTGFVMAWVTSAPAGTVTTHEALASRPGGSGGAPVIYWRPSCPFCLQLRFQLGSWGRRAYWINIRHDPAAAAYVRSVNGGDETVPTVILEGEAQTNPDPPIVRDAIVNRARR